MRLLPLSLFVSMVLIAACGVETEANPNCAANNTLSDVPRCIQCDEDFECRDGKRCINQACVEVDAAVGGTGGAGGDMDAGGEDGGGTGGSVDAGPDAPARCGVTCTTPTPHCDEESMTCVACLDSSHCGDDVCDTSSHTCVTCTATEGCASPLVCADDGNECVECNVDGNCIGDSVCKTGAHECVECNGEGDCTGGELCKDDNTCVECLADSDCNSAGAAKCNLTTNTCVPCTENTNCEGVTDGNVDLGVCDSGSCVECTATDYSACGTAQPSGTPFVCNSATQRCTDRRVGTAGPCATCVADLQCQNGLKCLEEPDSTLVPNRRCFYAKGNVGCADIESARRPYSRTVNLMSVDGVAAADYCLPVTTCAAVLDAQGNGGGKACSGSSECGELGVDDGVCNSNDQCTYACNADHNCPSTGFSECSGMPGYCQAP